ncbi:hypothetical protein OROMI_004986 [Orobanche minor]
MNPITREYSSLPPSEVERPKNTNRSYYTACGLGFDSQRNDYKVLRSVFNYYETFNGIFDDGRPDTTSCLQSQFEIYSLKNDSWKVIPYNIGQYKVVVYILIPESVTGEPIIPLAVLYPSTLRRKAFLPPYLYHPVYESGPLTVLTLLMIWINLMNTKWEEEFGVKVFGDHKPVGFGKNGRSLFLEGNYVVKKGAYQLLEYDLIDRYLKELPIFAEMSSCMHILSSSYDDPHANIFSGIVRKVFLPAAKQFLQG